MIIFEVMVGKIESIFSMFERQNQILKFIMIKYRSEHCNLTFFVTLLLLKAIQ